MERTFAHISFELDDFHSSRSARPLHIFCVFPKVNVEEIPDVAREAGVGAAVHRRGKNTYDLETASATRKRRATGHIIDFGHYWYILIRTIESPTTAGNTASRWIRRMYPAISHSYVRPNHLLNIMDHLSEIQDSKLEMRGYVLRSHDSPETMKKWPRDRPYTRKAIEQDIERENKLLEAINFIFRTGGTYFNTRMEADGHFVFYRGGALCFSNFYRLVLSRYGEIALDNRKFFSNRERRLVNGDVEISRISLQPRRILEKHDWETLKLYLSSHYSLAVLHSGNPWLQLNMIDRGDGSVFDIYGYHSKIEVVPFNRASPESLMRLFHTINELFPSMQLGEVLSQ